MSPVVPTEDNKAGITLLHAGQFDHLTPIPAPEPPREETIQEKIERVAKEHGVNVRKALAISDAESEFRPDAKNPYSSASGIYQFIDGTFRDYCINKYRLTDSMDYKNNPDIQIECAMRMLKAGEDFHWNASKHEWGKNL